MTCPTSPCLGMFSQSPLCVSELVWSYVCLSVSSLDRQGSLTHQHVFLITILHSSPSPRLAAGASRPCKLLQTVRYPMKPQRAACDEASHARPPQMSIHLSQEAPLLKDGNVIS